jgi:hypothetical protein
MRAPDALDHTSKRKKKGVTPLDSPALMHRAERRQQA